MLDISAKAECCDLHSNGCLYKVCASRILRQICSTLLWIWTSVLCCSAMTFLITTESRGASGSLFRLETYHLLNMRRHLSRLIQGHGDTEKGTNVTHKPGTMWLYSFYINLCEIGTSWFMWSMWREREGSLQVWIWGYGQEGLTLHIKKNMDRSLILFKITFIILCAHLCTF